MSGFFIAAIGVMIFFPALFTYPKISDIADFATLIATIVLIFTIFEMKEQRKTTYKPSIILIGSKELYYQFIFDPDRNSPLKFEMVNKHVFIGDKKEVNNSKFRIQGYNLGLGSANNVKIQFKYDYEKFVENIKKIDVKKDFEINLLNERVNIHFNELGVGFPIENFNYQSYDYLLPVNIDKNPLLIHIPAPFQHLYSAQIFSTFYSEAKSKPRFFEIPDIHMAITYQDIAGNNYSQKYLLKFRHTGIQNTFMNTFVNAAGYLEIKLE